MNGDMLCFDRYNSHSTDMARGGDLFTIDDSELAEVVFQLARRALPSSSRLPFQLRAMIRAAQAKAAKEVAT